MTFLTAALAFVGYLAWLIVCGLLLMIAFLLVVAVIARALRAFDDLLMGPPPPIRMVDQVEPATRMKAVHPRARVVESSTLLPFEHRTRTRGLSVTVKPYSVDVAEHTR